MLDKEILPFVQQHRDVESLSIEEERLNGEKAAALRAKHEVGRVVDINIDGPGGALPIRVYYPKAENPKGLLVFLHGGGFIQGSLETHDSFCRYLCHISGFAVGAVEYRLAPENKFPAALNDAEAATTWLLDNATNLGCDEGKVAIVGESAGGNLAAVVSQRLRYREGPRLRYQVIAFPLTDMRMQYPSYQRHENAPFLTAEAAVWCREQYLNGEQDIHDPDASPYLRKDLRGCPPAFVMTAEVDPLCDDGEAYARRLIESGVPVVMRRYLGLPHGFLFLPAELTAVTKAFADIKDVLNCWVAKVQ